MERVGMRRQEGLTHEYEEGRKREQMRKFPAEKQYWMIKESKFTLQNPSILPLRFFSSLTSELASSGYLAYPRDNASVDKLDRL